jgi:hypothetical protein
MIFFFLIMLPTAQAWIYPEHRELAWQALQGLDTQTQQTLSTAWQQARIGNESKLGDQLATPRQAEPTRKWVDFADFPAIAGDHSTSAAEMFNTITQQGWILDVIQITETLRADLKNADTSGKESHQASHQANRSAHINALRESDIKLQRADPDYATRAGSNNVHFLLSLTDPEEKARDYFIRCSQADSPLNAIGTYVFYHHGALIKAHQAYLTRGQPSESQKWAQAAFADEGFALHFLQDAFAAGHTAGTWGDASQRKGTHDYFNEHGIRLSNWQGKILVLTGDSWMRQADIDTAVVPIKISLKQLADSFRGEYFKSKTKGEIAAAPNSFNLSTQNYLPASVPQYQAWPIHPGSFQSILETTPVPGLVEGLGEQPRFRAELGPFVGFSPALRGSLLTGGFGMDQKETGWTTGLEMAVRFGFGMDGLLNESSDGLVFLGLGYRQDSASTSTFLPNTENASVPGLVSAVPSRSAYYARLRLPFYILPGDLLLAGPFLAIFSPKTLTAMGVVAANGGLIPWQSGMDTLFGRFQFVLGREFALYFFGRGKPIDSRFSYITTNGSTTQYLLSYQSNQYEFPFLEYRPGRFFGFQESSTFLLQFFAGIDDPHTVKAVVPTGANAPEQKSYGYIGARVIFDWRHYF